MCLRSCAILIKLFNFKIRLGKVLSDLNKAVQGIDRGGQSVIFTFKGKKEDESAGSSICQTMHEFRYAFHLSQIDK